ncbi:Bifunctional inhibitor/plant lipid transfer protein/seed storage helical domain-containing protein [Artemisia annua]|uniref:Non-specific lipid-transfer protein n=1 Tax=Artemisia annua TaxID=35608 RepID=A0A2U1KXY3_ARTAN|nr:Bifunctional inhibitor/plant lipid transfer protein/seed storage helical domain-containing protein [Artemisia annua]
MSGGANVAFMVVLIAMLASIPRFTEGGVTCQLVVSSLTPCATYLLRGGQVLDRFCKGVKSLYKEASTTKDRQTACRCIEQATTLVPGIKIDHAQDLPGKCDIYIPYKISPAFNRST